MAAKFDVGVLGCEALVDGSATSVSVTLPRGHLTSHGGHAGDTAIWALPAESAQFDLGDVPPAAVFGGVMDFKAFSQTTNFSGREGVVERGKVVGI